MLPTDAVTDQLSGNIVCLQRVCEWSASGLGSIKLKSYVIMEHVRVIAGTLTVR